MRRNLMWLAATLTVVVLLLGYRTSFSGPDAPLAAAHAGPGGGTGTSPVASDGGNSTTVTGDSVDTRWGPVQVAITVSGGKITAVDVPVYPYNNRRDQEINDYAIPQLVQETIDAQSADIDMVSGATVTSDGYLSSLQSALDAAGL